MDYLSKKNPFYFITCVTHNRIPVFQKDPLKYVMAKALDEARRSAEFLLFAYGIMPEHMHIITNSKLDESDSLRYLNGVTARRVIGHLKENGFDSSLLKLRTETKANNYKHSLWEHHSNTFEIKTEAVLMQKVNYIHQNPVEEGLCDRPEDYLFSSAKIWRHCPLANEPLRMDVDQIKWRRCVGGGASGDLRLPAGKVEPFRTALRRSRRGSQKVQNYP